MLNPESPFGQKGEGIENHIGGSCYRPSKRYLSLVECHTQDVQVAVSLPGAFYDLGHERFTAGFHSRRPSGRVAARGILRPGV